MTWKSAKVTVVMVIFLIAFVTGAYIFDIRPVNAQTGGLQIDVFTNKAPFNGKGANQTSDAFSPYETVVIYASVTYNGDPAGNFLVTFLITAPTPELPPQPRVAITNQTGLAMIQFKVLADNASQTAFGTWFVLGSTYIGELYALDTLTFKVGYIVTATMSTVEPVQPPQTPIEKQDFTRGDEVGLLITLTNIAMTSKNVTMAFVVKDALNQIIYTSPYMSLTMPPGNFSYPMVTFPIPTSAAAGTATISLSLFNQFLGKTMAYSPEATATFRIVLIDIAVTNATISSTQAYVGQIVTINATVKNFGADAATFNVTLNYNETALTSFNDTTLASGEQRTLTYDWNTSQMSVGIYTITAVASQLPNESNTANNHYTAGTVSIMQRFSIDVAVIDASLSSTQANIGQNIDITTIVKNLGDIPETFKVTIYANDTAITTFNVTTLNPNTQGTLTYTWNTSSLTAGKYAIKAVADQVPGETNLTNNEFVAGQVTLTSGSENSNPFNPRNLSILLWIIFIIFLLALLALLVLRRRKKDESETLEQISYFT